MEANRLYYWQSKIGFDFVIGKNLIGNLIEAKQIKTLLGIGFILTFRIIKSIDDAYQQNLIYDFEIFNTSEDIFIEEKNIIHDIYFINYEPRILEVNFEK